MRRLLGWNYEGEQKAKERLRANDDITILSVAETKDVISDRLKALTSETWFDYRAIPDSNYESGWSTYKQMPIRTQLSNDCTNHGLNAAFQWWQSINAYYGFKEQECFLGHRTFAYAAYGAYSGEYGDGGRTISAMLNGAAAIGILPEDTDGVPAYSKSLINSWTKRYSSMSNAPYAQYLPISKQYKITVGEMDSSIAMHWDACRAGLTVCHGSYNLHTLGKDGWYYQKGYGGHCRASAGWGMEGNTYFIGMENSWGDGWGMLAYETLKTVVQSRFYDAFCIVDMEVREAKTINWDLVPGE
jgi:hypothetical protein